MQVALRAVGFSLMTMFVSCGVGAHDQVKTIDNSQPLPALAHNSLQGVQTFDNSVQIKP
ncbi:hypothetical protein [Pseudomonas sp. NPDC089569]|uniref:hypothetical protein n=1 Tax=Pseudomonas sp. NPDC089569 TaxID=3390722 RepID=UPI003D01D811